MMMMSENLEHNDDVTILPPQEVEPHREEEGHCPLPFRWVNNSPNPPHCSSSTCLFFMCVFLFLTHS